MRLRCSRQVSSLSLSSLGRMPDLGLASTLYTRGLRGSKYPRQDSFLLANQQVCFALPTPTIF